MIRVAVLACQHTYMSSLSGFLDTLQIANDQARRQLGEFATAFRWQLLSMDGSPISGSAGLTLQVDAAMKDAAPCDLVYVPGFYYPGSRVLDSLLTRQEPVYDWLRQRWAQGATIATNCTGSFLLAQSGLLDGRRATAPWWLEKQFGKRYPNVCLDVRQLITEHDRLICAGGASSYLPLAVRLVERYVTASVSSSTAKMMLSDAEHSDQPVYVPSKSGVSHNDPLIAAAEYWLQQRLATPVTQQMLARDLGVSQRTLIRRFKCTLGTTPLTYLQNLRLEAARRLLESTRLDTADIVERVGYKDVNSFARLFRERLGVTPTAYRGLSRAPR